MEFKIEIWLEILTKKLFDTFFERIQFIGLQGSYGRNEAHTDSDIDIVIILDKLTFEDLQLYKNIIASMPCKEKACGYIGGIEDIASWPKYDLFQLLNDTVSLYGSLADFIPKISKDDIITAIKVNSANLYHMLCHSFLFENKNIEVLKNCYKSTFFIMQAVYTLENNYYPKNRAELSELITESENSEILTISNNLKTLNIEANVDFYYELLINWCQKHLNHKF